MWVPHALCNVYLKSHYVYAHASTECKRESVHNKLVIKFATEYTNIEQGLREKTETKSTNIEPGSRAREEIDSTNIK